MYICTKCVGSCDRYKTEDTKTKEAYKCNECGHIIHFRKESKSVIREQIKIYRKKITEYRNEIFKLEGRK